MAARARSAAPRPSRSGSSGRARSRPAPSTRARPAARSAARPARGRARRPRGARVQRDRLYLAGIAVLVMVLGVMAVGPYADLTAAQTRVSALEGEQVALDTAVEALQSEAERLQDPAALEEQAREQLGMARPGEIPYIVTNPSEKAPMPVNASPAIPPEIAQPSLVDRVIDLVRGLTG